MHIVIAERVTDMPGSIMESIQPGGRVSYGDGCSDDLQTDQGVAPDGVRLAYASDAWNRSIMHLAEARPILYAYEYAMVQ